MTLRTSTAIIARQLIVQSTMVICGIVMARRSTPAEFGVYALCNFLVPLLAVCSDLGLGAWLIRAPEPPGTAGLRTVFTVRQIADTAVVTVFLILSRTVAAWYSLADDSVASVRWLAAVPFLSSLSVVSTVRLERDLRFGVIALIESTQIVCCGAVILYGLAHGLGPVAAAYGWLVHAATGALLYQIASPWLPRWQLDRRFLSEALPFSLPFQSTAALMTLRDGALPLMVAALFGGTAVGVLNWAQMLALSIALGTFVAQRPLLPIFSRAATGGDHAQIAADAELALHGLLSFVIASAGSILLFSKPLCRFIFGEQWFDALPLFFTLWPLNLLVPTIVVVTALLNAMGRSAAVFRAHAAGTAVLWLVTALAAGPLGVWSYPLALSLAQLTVLALSLPIVGDLGWHPLRRTAAAATAAAAAIAVSTLLGVASIPTSVMSLLACMSGYAVALATITALALFAPPARLLPGRSGSHDAVTDAA